MRFGMRFVCVVCAGASQTAVMAEAPSLTLRNEVEMKLEQICGEENRTRIVQELVPGKQITLAHMIANPDAVLYEKLGLDPKVELIRSAIGILTVSPAETAIIMADLAVKSSGAQLGFVDRFSGSLIITGTVSEVEAAIQAILDYVENKLGYTVCQVTKT